MSTVAVTIAVYNEEALIDPLLDALLAQTRTPDEIVFVDDGSTDRTAERIQRRAAHDARIRCIRQQNAGPAAARNRAWREARSEICVFTDGDCVPEPTWIAELIAPFEQDGVGAAGGTYRTLNADNLLASFVGWEIAWRYRDVGDAVDCHGTYNLAIRRSVLERLGGFDESYRHPSGEDFDLTYRISRAHRIAFVRNAVVAHEHPDALWPYLRLQARRAFDRVRLYRNHTDKARSDSYTSSSEKYQVLAAALLPCAIAAWPVVPVPAFAASSALAAFMIVAAVQPLAFIARRDPKAAAYGVLVRLVRPYAWGIGVVLGVLDGALTETTASSSRVT